MSCSAGCATPGAHGTYGECLRAKSTRVAYCNSAAGLDATAQKRWDKRLDTYRDAKRQGIQPASTKATEIRRAIEVSDQTGVAYNAERTLA